MPVIQLTLLPDEYAVCRLPPDAPLPSWATVAPLFSATRTWDEFSVVCAAHQVPAGVKSEAGWRALRFHGPFAFTQTGILASVVAPLASAGISVFALSTFDTDYVLLPGAKLAAAIAELRAAGHVVNG
jgi:hypothetical protein